MSNRFHLTHVGMSQGKSPFTTFLENWLVIRFTVCLLFRSQFIVWINILPGKGMQDKIKISECAFLKFSEYLNDLYTLFAIQKSIMYITIIRLRGCVVIVLNSIL